MRRRLGSKAVEGFFAGASRFGRALPAARLSAHGVEAIYDVPYRETGLPEHTLDVYRPCSRSGRAPVVLYMHGGGFRILSKETHWLFALIFARRGYVVFNINYRLAPSHPFPAAIEDACHAFAWVRQNAAAFGGDPNRIVLAGESAGANMGTALAVASAWPRPEPWARPLFDAPPPSAVVPACGLLQVSDPERFGRKRKVSRFIMDRVTEVSEAYLVNANLPEPGGLDLADPLVVLERGESPLRPLPPFFAFCGTRDIVIDDTRRLESAIKRIGGVCEARYYRGGIHAFHAFVFASRARLAWKETFEFLDRYVPPTS